MRFTQAVVLIMLIFVVGCGSSTKKEAADMSKATYQMDERTGLCFVTLGYTKSSGLESLLGVSNGLTISWVPCEEKVLKAIASGG